MLEAYWRSDYASPGERTEIKLRGPLTLAQVEEDLVTADRRMLQMVRKRQGVEDIGGEEVGLRKEWLELKSKYRDGDELHSYLATAKPSWEQTAGYVLIRGSEIVGVMLTFMT